LGICSDRGDHLQSFALVLEYSPYGTLKAFLSGKGEAVSTVASVDLILQVGRGLAALHGLKVAHCDVKTENVLVFSEDGAWRAKVSDFGQSLVAPRDSPNARLELRHGTPLLNAPEIRKGRAFLDPQFDIHAALLTDVFSFGLLAWEVLKHGQCFFDVAWVGRDMTIGEMEAFLNRLPPDRLCAYAAEFLDTVTLELPLRSALRLAFNACLADSPGGRKSMPEAVEILIGESDPQR